MPVAAPIFLCESCGYDLSATDPAARCPECGRAVVDSHHSSRIGSPYQHNPRFRSAATTFFLFISNPIALFRESSPREGPLFGYFAWISACSTAAVVSPAAAVSVAVAFHDLYSPYTPHAPTVEILFGIAALVFVLLIALFVGFVVWLGLYMLSRLLIELWSAAVRLRTDADVVAYTCSSAFLIGALGIPAGAFVAYLSNSHIPITIIPPCFAALALFFWLRGVHIGLSELRYANPPPIARDESETPSPAHVFTENITPPAR